LIWKSGATRDGSGALQMALEQDKARRKRSSSTESDGLHHPQAPKEALERVLCQLAPCGTGSAWSVIDTLAEIQSEARKWPSQLMKGPNLELRVHP